MASFEEEKWELYGELTTECGAMCLIPTSREEYEAIKDNVAVNSVFIRPERPCRVYFEEDTRNGWRALLSFGSNEPLQQIKSIIAENSLEYVGTVAVTEDMPYLRIVDAREAHYVPKEPTQAQLEYAAKKANCSQEIMEALSAGEFNEDWHLSERLISVPEVYRTVFWTGLDPAPLLAACEAEGLSGWVEVDEKWSLPPVNTLEEAVKQYRSFKTIKKRLRFRCGYDMQTTHFIYDICHSKVEASPHQGAEYPTNQGTAVALVAHNDSYDVVRLGNADDLNTLAYIICQK